MLFADPCSAATVGEEQEVVRIEETIGHQSYMDSLGWGGSIPPIVTSGRLAAKYDRIAARLNAETGAGLHLARYTRRHD
ncbi:MAG: hypothetical protein LAQ30_26580 [Acidobacteriia bacterium]|nr:hypothetical protein [Terriglobia bacterium]